jgi:hypothetical protein
MREDLGQLRNELGSLRYRLDNEVRLMKEQGPYMSLDEREALDKNIREGLVQAKDLEDRIVHNSPNATAARQALAAAREAAAPLMKQMDAAHLEKQRLLKDGISNQLQMVEISSQDAAIDKLAKALEPLVANQNAALGMNPQLIALIDLVETRKEIDSHAEQTTTQSLPSAARDNQWGMQRLNAKARDLEDVIVAGDRMAKDQLALLRNQGSALEKEAYRLMDEVYLARKNIAGKNLADLKHEPQTIARLEKELAGVNADLNVVRMATDKLLGLAELGQALAQEPEQRGRMV